jgi:predicted MFS family arabinose efflux permease
MALIVVLPLFAGLLADTLHLDSARLGVFASSDMGGTILGSLASAAVIRRLRWETLAMTGAVVLTAGNVLSGLAPSYEALIAFRVLAGFGGGLLMGVSFAIFAANRAPERPFAIFAAAQTLFAAFAFLVLPSVMHAFGPRGAFWSLAIVAAPAVAIASMLKRPGSVEGGRVGLSASARSLLGNSPLLAGVTSVLVYFAGQGAVWAFVERFATAAGLSDETISVALSISQVPAVLGAVLVSIVGNRFGRVGPLCGGFALSLGAMVALFWSPNAFVYAVVVGAFLFGWNVFISYQAAIVAGTDPTKAVMPLVAAATSGGLFLGPLLAGRAANHAGLSAVLILGISLNVAALALMVPLRRALADGRAK